MISLRLSTILSIVFALNVYGYTPYTVHWGCFHHDAARTGLFTLLKGDMDICDTLWTFKAKDDVHSSPALGDIDRDGKMEVVIGTGTGAGNTHDTRILALNGENGSLLWFYGTGSGVVSSPALGDINGDGKLEVVVASQYCNVYGLNGEDGSLLWSYTAGSSISSSPALGDIDGDGRLEVVIGCFDSKVYALNGEDGSFLWSYAIPGEPIIPEYSPALGDIDGDGKLEVVIGSLFDCGIHALNGEDGSFLWSYTATLPVRTSPALGDIEGDGKLEVVIGTGYMGAGKVYALNGENGSSLWSYNGGTVLSSPALADIDGDSGLEVVTGGYEHYGPSKVYALNGWNGSLIWTYEVGDWPMSSAAIGDIDGDGGFEVVIGATDCNVYCLNGEDGLLVWSYTTGSVVSSSPALGDIDGDDKLEIVVGSWDWKVYALNRTVPGVEESANLNPELDSGQISKLEVYPNPFSGKTVIRYQAPEARGTKQEARLTIYDLTGRLVKSFLINQSTNQLINSISWDGKADNDNRLSSGIYFCKLRVGEESLTKQLLLLR